MTAPTLAKGSEKPLRNLCSSVAKAIAENIGSLVGVEIEVQLGTVTLVDGEEHIEQLPRQITVVRGALSKDYADRMLWIVFDSRDAATMSGLMMMTPEHVIEEHRKKGKIGEEDLEAFGEVGNILCSGIDDCLRKARGDKIGLRLKDHGTIDPGIDEEGLVGNGTFAVYEFPFKVGGYDEGKARLLLDLETAEKWNGVSLVTAPGATGGGDDEAADGKESRASKAIVEQEEEDEEELPPAEIRGRLAAFLYEGEIWSPVRKTCRRVGFEVERHGPSEIPNPAAHKGEVVLIEVPANDDKRFEWCKRLKNSPHGIRVVLFLHLPTRQRVLAGFMAQADVILGPPLSIDLLREKLEALLED